jgi:hypothetical protein
MSLGILQTGPGRPVSDGVLGSAMVSGPGYTPYRSGSLGEYFEAGISGLGGGCGCGLRGLGEGALSIPTSMVLGVVIGAAVMYLGGCEMMKK